jgi:MoxR-like ATPase
MRFRSVFDDPAAARRHAPQGAGDFRSGAAYLFTPEMELALSAAWATHRPLLITGPAGCGKSSLARAAATRLGWRFLERTVNSRTEVTSLLWEVDQLARLQDANLKKLDEDLLAYVRPAVLWQALDPLTAAEPRRLRDERKADDTAELRPAVVLIDEIDKADPDLPNNLLEVLGGLRFEVADTGKKVLCHAGVPLIVITSNDERDLPPAFVRRCIALALKQPELGAVARLHFPAKADGDIIDAALKLLAEGTSTPPSAAEFLDFVQACRELRVAAGSPDWLALAEACVTKGRAAGVRGG